jgi:P27 family predicted phage terminase small subunit
MRTGRPRKPDALKKFEGTYRKDRANPAALDLPPGVPERPAGLDRDATAIWTELTTDAAWRVVLTRVDAIGLELLVKHMSLERRFAVAAAKKPIVKTPFGPKANPAVSESRKEAAVVKQLLSEFGLTPSARSRVSKPGAPASPLVGTDGTPLVGPGLRAIDGGRVG